VRSGYCDASLTHRDADRHQGSGSLESDLQLRYTELLEKRIAQLEALVNGTSKSPEAEKKESNTDDSKKTEVAKVHDVRRTSSGSHPSVIEADMFY
jgi:hypothetical protein